MTPIPLPPQVDWPYQAILLRLALALSLGLLIGLERERRRKEAGLRTFGFIGILGALGGTLGDGFAMLVLVLTALLAVPLNIQTMRRAEGAELTTSAAMLITCLAGVLCGKGHTVTPAAVMVMTTALLAWKERLVGFSAGLTEGEVRSSLLLAILAIVIYPALPRGSVGPMGLIEPRAAWVAVILIAGIGFVNYILWKLYGDRGTELSGLFGGLVNSNFTVIELSNRVLESNGRFAAAAYRGILVATAAMVVRNATLLLVLAPTVFINAAPAFVLMLLAGAVFLLQSWRRRPVLVGSEAAPLQLSLPFSLPVALRYGLLFLVLHVAGRLMQSTFGEAGFYLVSIVGGLLSSASAVAAAASMAAQGAVQPAAAGIGAVLASLTSLAFSLSFVLRTRDRALVSRLALAMACMMLAAVAGVLFAETLRPWMPSWEVWLGP